MTIKGGGNRSECETIIIVAYLQIVPNARMYLENRKKEIFDRPFLCVEERRAAQVGSARAHLKDAGGRRRRAPISLTKFRRGENIYCTALDFVGNASRLSNNDPRRGGNEEAVLVASFFASEGPLRWKGEDEEAMVLPDGIIRLAPNKCRSHSEEAKLFEKNIFLYRDMLCFWPCFYKVLLAYFRSAHLATLQGSLLRGEEEELTNNVPLEEEKEHLLQGLFHNQRRRYYDTPPKPLLIKPGLRYPFLHTKSSVEKQALIVEPFQGHLFVRRRKRSVESKEKVKKIQESWCMDRYARAKKGLSEQLSLFSSLSLRSSPQWTFGAKVSSSSSSSAPFSTAVDWKPMEKNEKERQKTRTELAFYLVDQLGWFIASVFGLNWSHNNNNDDNNSSHSRTFRLRRRQGRGPWHGFREGGGGKSTKPQLQKRRCANALSSFLLARERKEELWLQTRKKKKMKNGLRCTTI